MILDDILRQPHNTLECYVRESAYGTSGHAELVRDVMGLANLPGSEPRYIIIGAQREEGGIVPRGLDEGDLTDVEEYVGIIRQYLEPELHTQLSCSSVKGKIVAVLQIAQCNDAPYMASIDLSETLRTGACWVRDAKNFRPARRDDLDRMFGQRANAPAENSAATDAPPVKKIPVELGFNTEPGRDQFATRLPDLSSPPSTIAAKRLQDQIQVVKAAGERDVADTSIARLMHTQQYGSESTYDERGVNTLVENYNSVSSEYHDADDYYFNETNAFKLTLCIRNNGDTDLENLSVVLSLPVVDEFRAVDHLWSAPDSPRSKHESDLLGYPEVTYSDGAAQVRQQIDALPAGGERPLFESALRIALKPEIAGKKIAIRYVLQADGLESDQEGMLKLLIRG